jgi:chitin synthase
MDDFSWGNTRCVAFTLEIRISLNYHRQVVGEGNNKTVLYEDDEPFSDSMIPLKSFKGEYTPSLVPLRLMHSRLRGECLGDGIATLRKIKGDIPHFGPVQ